MTYGTREEWLKAAVEEIRPLFAEHKHKLPRYRVSVMPPTSRKAIGENWDRKVTADGASAIFISAKLSDKVDVLQTLVHELVHAVDDNKSGHTGAFRKIATELGLEGKMTETHAGDELKKKLRAIGKTLGAYPHSAMSPELKEKKQGTRMLKLECSECGYTVRTTQKWIDIGIPECPVDLIELVQEQKP